MQPQPRLADIDAWCQEIRARNSLSKAHKEQLLGVAQHFYTEMIAADKHYADGYFDPAIPPFAEVEESTRGRCAMVQYNATTHPRVIKQLCEYFQEHLNAWIDMLAHQMGWQLPLQWQP